MSRKFSSFRAVVPLALALAGCAAWCPPKKTVKADNPPFNNPPDCACTLEYRMNLCVTLNGSKALPDSLWFQREREDGTRDALDGATTDQGMRCFGEARGLQRILMYRSSAVVDSSGWFDIPTVDCCHGQARTVNFMRF